MGCYQMFAVCEIIIKPSDKTGGVCVLDYDPYVKVMENKLGETYLDITGNQAPKYIEVKEDSLKGTGRL